jgi:DNA-binding FadR family transcriptional regulator
MGDGRGGAGRALNSQMVRFQFRTILIPGRPAQSIEEHTAIVDALTEGQPEAAERAMRWHLNQVAKGLHASHGSPAGSERRADTSYGDAWGGGSGLGVP